MAARGPSISTGVRRAVACAMKPASAARFGEPMVCTTSQPSRLRARNIESRTTLTRAFHIASVIPLARVFVPTIATGSVWVIRPMTLAATVLAPIPKPDVMSRSVPESISRSAVAMPSSMCDSHSAGDIAAEGAPGSVLVDSALHSTKSMPAPARCAALKRLSRHRSASLRECSVASAPSTVGTTLASAPSKTMARGR